mgnify:CR=1 FL=1
MLNPILRMAVPAEALRSTTAMQRNALRLVAALDRFYARAGAVAAVPAPGALRCIRRAAPTVTGKLLRREFVARLEKGTLP